MLHSDDKKIQKLIEQQYALSAKVVLRPPFSADAVTTVGGLDVHYDGETALSVACAVIDIRSMKLVEKVCLRHDQDTHFPYIPGLFAFREMPALLDAVRALSVMPDVFICDGQGIAHPRRCGLATHLGVAIGKPTIGCAKTHFYGTFVEPPPGLKGAYQYLRDDGDILGIVLRTKPFVKPVFVSPGHLMDVETAGDIVMKCTTKFRIPEPLRRAHTLAAEGK